MRGRTGIVSAGGLLLGVGIVALAQLAGGGNLRMLLQPTAFAVVVGGTAAALIVSFPGRTLRAAVVAGADAFLRRVTPPDALIATFLDFAEKTRRQGLLALEAEIQATQDGFLARALALAVSGLPTELVRQTLEIDSRTSSDRDEQLAEVFEAAAGYSPTLGIVGAVLGLMSVMRHLASAGDVGSGIAAAFVATIYGVGAANLIFLPIATRLRVQARLESLRRELTIDGILALGNRVHPSLLEDRLNGYLKGAPSDGRSTAA